MSMYQGLQLRSFQSNAIDEIECAHEQGGKVLLVALGERSELDRWAEARIGPPQRSTSEVDPA